MYSEGDIIVKFSKHSVMSGNNPSCKTLEQLGHQTKIIAQKAIIKSPLFQRNYIEKFRPTPTRVLFITCQSNKANDCIVAFATIQRIYANPLFSLHFCQIFHLFSIHYFRLKAITRILLLSTASKLFSLVHFHGLQRRSRKL